MRLAEDQQSVTTSIDNYPFSPSSPWAHALPSRQQYQLYYSYYLYVVLFYFRYNRYGYPVFPQKNFGIPSPSGKIAFQLSLIYMYLLQVQSHLQGSPHLPHNCPHQVSVQHLFINIFYNNLIEEARQGGELSGSISFKYNKNKNNEQGVNSE